MIKKYKDLILYNIIAILVVVLLFELDVFFVEVNDMSIVFGIGDAVTEKLNSDSSWF